MEQTYLYEVRPHRIITGIHGVPYIRSPRAVYLTKDEVYICLQNGSVYRRFANLDKLERVTVTNVDRLHNEKFISEEEWIGTKKEEPTAAPAVEEPKVEPVVEEPKQEEAPAAVEEEPASVEEPVVEADEAAPEEVAEAPVEEVEATEKEGSDDSEVVEEEEKADEAAPQQQNNNNVQFKSHHGKKHNKK